MKVVVLQHARVRVEKPVLHQASEGMHYSGCRHVLMWSVRALRPLSKLCAYTMMSGCMRSAHLDND